MFLGHCVVEMLNRKHMNLSELNNTLFIWGSEQELLQLFVVKGKYLKSLCLLDHHVR